MMSNLFSVSSGGDYYPTHPPLFAKGSKYGRLQTNGRSYLCPECGGYGKVGKKKCRFCMGEGILCKDDLRIHEGK